MSAGNLLSSCNSDQYFSSLQRRICEDGLFPWPWAPPSPLHPQGQLSRLRRSICVPSSQRAAWWPPRPCRQTWTWMRACGPGGQRLEQPSQRLHLHLAFQFQSWPWRPMPFVRVQLWQEQRLPFPGSHLHLLSPLRTGQALPLSLSWQASWS